MTALLTFPRDGRPYGREGLLQIMQDFRTHFDPAIDLTLGPSLFDVLNPQLEG
jgi:hypothetical protein